MKQPKLKRTGKYLNTGKGHTKMIALLPSITLWDISTKDKINKGVSFCWLWWQYVIRWESNNG